MLPYNLICDDVITFELLLTTIPANLAEQCSFYLRNAFNLQYLIDKLTIIACQVLLQQMFSMKCWFVHQFDKNGLTKICLISECYFYMQLEPTSKLAAYDTTDTNFSFRDLFLAPYCLPFDGLGIRHVWRHSSHMEHYTQNKYDLKQTPGTM